MTLHFSLLTYPSCLKTAHEKKSYSLKVLSVQFGWLVLCSKQTEIGVLQGEFRVWRWDGVQTSLVALSQPGHVP